LNGKEKKKKKRISGRLKKKNDPAENSLPAEKKIYKNIYPAKTCP
jgi:hypothetical protein